MATRLLHFRFAFAVLALAALIAGALLETVWLAGPGAVAAAISDVMGLMQARSRFNLPIERAMRSAAEALPALAVTAFEPWAIGVTVSLVVFTLLANGMNTISVAKGRNRGRQPMETMRRLLTAPASLLLLCIPLRATSHIDLLAHLRLSARGAVTVSFLVVTAAGILALSGMLISVKSRKGESAPATAPNVDT